MQFAEILSGGENMLQKLVVTLLFSLGFVSCNQGQKSAHSANAPDEKINCGRALCKPDEPIAKSTSVCNDPSIPFAIQSPFQTSQFFDAEKSFGLTMRYILIGNGNDMSTGTIRAKVLCFDKNTLSKTTSFQYIMSFSMNGNKVTITNPEEHNFNQEPTLTKVGCQVTIPQSQIEYEILSINSCLQLKFADQTQLLVPTNNF
jgi:hypothetical protein